MGQVTPPAQYRGAFRTDAAARGVYSETTGIIQQLPVAVAQPLDSDDVAELVRWCAGQRLPIVARGSGTGMAGAATGPGLVLDLHHLRTAPALLRAGGLVRVSPATTVNTLNAALRVADLWFPVEPSSAHIATIGGMIATNAAGARSLRYGAMRPWVHALDCVFSDGSRATVRRGAPLPRIPILDAWRTAATELRERASAIPRKRVRKDSSGYGIFDFVETGDLIDLFVGSEGTLAIFTGAELAIRDKPAATCTVRACWSDLNASVSGARIAREANADACELLERTFLDVARRGGGLDIPHDTDALLLIELSGSTRADLEPRATALKRALLRAGATSVALGATADEERQLWEIRHAASATLARLEPSIKSLQVIEDGCVPPERLGDYVRGVKLALRHTGFRGVIFGHAGDAHLHVNVLLNPADQDWKPRLRQLFERVMSLTRELGGTPSGEHGDGRLRTAELAKFWTPDALELFATIKRLFDPLGLLNPGVKVPADGWEPWGVIKYDRELAPLAPEARDVLHALEKSRAFSSNRLSLLPWRG